MKGQTLTEYMQVDRARRKLFDVIFGFSMPVDATRKLDVVKLDAILGARIKDYDPDKALYKGKPASLKDVILAVYGEIAVNLINTLLGGEMKSEIKEKIEALRQTMSEAVYIVNRIISFLKAHDYAVDQSSLVDSVKKMDYHTRKALEHYMLEDDPDKVLDLLGRSGGGIKVKEEGRDSPKGVVFPQMKAAEEPQVKEALTFAAEKYFSTFYAQFLKLFKDEEKAAVKAVDKVVRTLKLKPHDRDELLRRLQDKLGVKVSSAKLVGVAEKIEQLKKS